MNISNLFRGLCIAALTSLLFVGCSDDANDVDLDDGGNEDDVVTVTQMKIQINTPSDNYILSMLFSDVVASTISWGEGATDASNVTSSMINSYDTAGAYTIVISGEEGCAPTATIANIAAVEEIYLPL